jgi:Zn-dependent protease
VGRLQYPAVGLGNFGLLGLLQSDPLAFLLLAVALVEAIAMHEFAHALVADLQGDRLPRAMGRLSLNPVRHLDPLGTIFLVLVGFGWGRPVEFRREALSSQRFGAAMVALAGPATNLLLGIAGAFALAALPTPPPSVLFQFLGAFISVNVILAVFNLLPVPPLDGSRLLTIFLPPSRQNVIFFLDRWGMLILLAILFFGGGILGPLIDGVLRWVVNLPG